MKVTKGTGIYFLLRGTIVVYIGKTKHFPYRLFGHRGKDYDSVRFIPCCEGALNRYEFRWIRRFEPEMNVMCKPKPPMEPVVDFIHFDDDQSVSQYAKSVNLTRDAVYKQIAEKRLPKGVTVKEYLGRVIIRVSGSKEKPIV